MNKFALKKTVAEFLKDKIDGSGKTLRDIAVEIGYENATVISAFLNGSMKIPTKVVAPLARALNIDSVHFLRLVMGEYMPETCDALDEVLGGTVMTENEREMLACYRRVTRNTDPPAVILGGIVALMVPEES